MEWEQSTPMDFIKGLVWNSQVIKYDMHEKKAGKNKSWNADLSQPRWVCLFE